MRLSSASMGWLEAWCSCLRLAVTRQAHLDREAEMVIGAKTLTEQRQVGLS